MTCARGCVVFRKHNAASCRVEDGSAGVWLPWTPPDGFAYPPEVGEFTLQIDGKTERLHATQRGQEDFLRLEIWYACNGCVPRRASHGCLCESCHLRMQSWLGWAETPGSLAWAYDWIAPDLEPGQNAAPNGKIRQGKPAPPAALALHVHVLRQDIAKTLGQWLRSLTQEFDLHGPDWWHHRVEHRPDDESSWRFWLPQNHQEIRYAVQYLATWLDRIEGVPDLVTMMYREAELLLRRVIALAPWEPKRTRLPKLQCPECERESVTIATGDEHLTCRRCGVLIPRAKYDRWSYLIASEREAVS